MKREILFRMILRKFFIPKEIKTHFRISSLQIVRAHSTSSASQKVHLRKKKKLKFVLVFKSAIKIFIKNNYFLNVVISKYFIAL